MPAKPVIPGSLFDFLMDLERHNHRTWFQENKDRHESELRGPALSFIEGFAPLLAKISPHFRADARKVGGSLFRIHRDVRFSKDKRPYKTHTGIQFRHEQGKDAHCPGYYVHLSPQECFLGVGIWHPEKDTLAAIRAGIDRDPAGWKKASRGKRFMDMYSLAGDSLKKAPKGWSVDHPLIEDLRRKDFIAVAPLEPEAVIDPGFAADLSKRMKVATPLMKWLCDALGVPF
jgi:uncharacterized protein (TIGR02453 family)